MAKSRKGKRNKKGSGHVVPAKGPALDTAIADEVEAALPDLGDDGPAWGALQKTLLKSTLTPADIATVVMRRDREALTGLLKQLRGEAVDDTPPAPAPVADIDDAVLREAMKAFRKRLKLTKLDHESRLGRSPLSTGKGADFDSILPPHQYGTDVWDALVAKGELVNTGQGFYGLPAPPPTMRGKT